MFVSCKCDIQLVSHRVTPRVGGLVLIEYRNSFILFQLRKVSDLAIHLNVLVH